MSCGRHRASCRSRAGTPGCLPGVEKARLPHLGGDRDKAQAEGAISGRSAGWGVGRRGRTGLRGRGSSDGCPTCSVSVFGLGMAHGSSSAAVRQVRKKQQVWTGTLDACLCAGLPPGMRWLIAQLPLALTSHGVSQLAGPSLPTPAWSEAHLRGEPPTVPGDCLLTAARPVRQTARL